MRILAIGLGALSVFLTFWTVRLLVVTGGLRNVRPDGHGAYVGAIVFPVLAIAFGWASLRCWRRGGRH